MPSCGGGTEVFYEIKKIYIIAYVGADFNRLRQCGAKPKKR